MPEFTICVDEVDVQQLRQLCGEGYEHYSDSVVGVIEQLVHAAADGVRREGSWERGWIQQATGWSGALPRLT